MKNNIEEFIETSSSETLKRFIRMCWEDRTPFEVIATNFNLGPNDIIKTMRKLLPTSDFNRWRRRSIKFSHLKHLKKSPRKFDRFKCSRQRLDGSIKGSK